MKGYIKIEATTHEGREGLEVQTELEHVSFLDRMQVLHSLCHALHIKPRELKLMADLIGSGFMEEVVETKVLSDDTEIGIECACKGKKKPNVHIIGGTPEDLLELLKALMD